MAWAGRVFCDTSFFFACLSPRDAHHQRAGELLDRARDDGWALYTTWDVVSETVTLLRARLGFSAALAFLDRVKPTLRIVEYGQQARAEAEEVFRRYGDERRLSFCEAISFVVATTLLDGAPCLAFNEDFRALGLTVVN
jgi:predicted nucleic acid-binding protein